MSEWQVVGIAVGLVVSHCLAGAYGVYVGVKAMGEAVAKRLEGRE